MEDIRSEVMNGYQNFLENEWTGELNKKYSVSIEEPVLEEVKRELAK
jgi:hypothetical protein